MFSGRPMRTHMDAHGNEVLAAITIMLAGNPSTQHGISGIKLRQSAGISALSLLDAGPCAAWFGLDRHLQHQPCEAAACSMRSRISLSEIVNTPASPASNGSRHC